MVCKQMSWHLGWMIQPPGVPPPPPVHRVQQVLMTGFRDRLWSISREDHIGGTLKDVGTEERNDMKLAIFLFMRNVQNHHLESDLYVLGLGDLKIFHQISWTSCKTRAKLIIVLKEPR